MKAVWRHFSDIMSLSVFAISSNQAQPFEMLYRTRYKSTNNHYHNATHKIGHVERMVIDTSLPHAKIWPSWRRIPGGQLTILKCYSFIRDRKSEIYVGWTWRIHNRKYISGYLYFYDLQWNYQRLSIYRFSGFFHDQKSGIIGLVEMPYFQALALDKIRSTALLN